MKAIVILTVWLSAFALGLAQGNKQASESNTTARKVEMNGHFYEVSVNDTNVNIIHSTECFCARAKK